MHSGLKPGAESGCPGCLCQSNQAPPCREDREVNTTLPLPETVPGDREFVSLSVSNSHACMLDAAGAAFCVGESVPSAPYHSGGLSCDTDAPHDRACPRRCQHMDTLAPPLPLPLANQVETTMGSLGWTPRSPLATARTHLWPYQAGTYSLP